MKVTKLKGSNKRTGICQLGIEGEMTIYFAQQMLQTCLPYFSQYKQFALDLSKVSEIDTAGIQLLLQFHRKAKNADKSLQILSCSQAVQELIELFRLTERFDVQVAS